MAKEQSILEYFLCGGFGGICTVVVGHPLDTIKVRLQTMPIPQPGEKPKYSGMLDCFKQIVAKEGPLGVYKGMGAPLAAIVPIFAISFMSYGSGKKMLEPSPEKKNSFLFCGMQYFGGGALAGFLTTIVAAPGERIKCLLQTQAGGGEKLYNGSIDAAIKLYKQGGIKSIYKGSLATILRDVPASALYYTTYDTFKDIVTDRGKTEMGLVGAIFGGGFAGMANWIIGMPADVVKSRLQTSPEGAYPNGQSDVVKEILAREGPLAFYKGIAPVLIRAFPANAACFVGFELCKNFLNTFVF